MRYAKTGAVAWGPGQRVSWGRGEEELRINSLGYRPKAPDEPPAPTPTGHPGGERQLAEHSVSTALSVATVRG